MSWPRREWRGRRHATPPPGVLAGRSSPCSRNHSSAWRTLPSSATLSIASWIAAWTRRSGSFSSRSPTLMKPTAGGYRAHLAEADLGDHALEAGTRDATGSGAAEVVIDHLNLRPAEL